MQIRRCALKANRNTCSKAMETVALCMDETTFYQKLDAIKKSKNGNSQLTVFVNNELYKGLCGNATLLFQNLIKNSNVL